MKKKQQTFSYLFIVCFILGNIHCFSQSFNEEKTAMINYVKRMYTTSPFEGAKLIEGDEKNYYIVAISLTNDIKNTSEKQIINAENKAQEAAKNTFAEPCIKFEMLATIPDDGKKKTTFLFVCQPLSEFLTNAYKKQAFDGAKIIATPTVNYFISVVTLDNAKYTSSAMMDRVALIKAKSQANTLFNGSTITSDIVIYTGENTRSNTTQTTEVFKEQAMGFVEGLENLLKFDSNEKKIYLFFRELTSK
jgi:hypothetical protein